MVSWRATRTYRTSLTRRPHHVSHQAADHTPLLALIEKRFLRLDEDNAERLHLTARDLHAATLEDLFDFTGAPSRNVAVPAQPVGKLRTPSFPVSKEMSIGIYSLGAASNFRIADTSTTRARCCFVSDMAGKCNHRPNIK
jgi:hypothetical protein